MIETDEIVEICDGAIENEAVEVDLDSFDSEDFKAIADYIHEELHKRKKDTRREAAEKIWKEVDRQISLTPSVKHKVDPYGRRIPENAWMPEMELPFQSIALEVLTADTLSFLFPDSGLWFSAHADATDDYLDKASSDIKIRGDNNETTSIIIQDNADRVTEGILAHFMDQSGFIDNMKDIVSGALKYNIGVGRARIVKKASLSVAARGMRDVQDDIPVLVPASIKDIYPDFSKTRLMNEGIIISESVIAHKKQSFSDLVLAANSGSTDPEDMDGGWMPKALEGFSPDDDGDTDVYEYEGDIVMPRETKESLYIPNVIVTVAVSGGDKRVVRFRFSQFNRSSYLFFPYHVEQCDNPYSSSVLMSAMPIQAAACEMLNGVIMSSALANKPVLTYDSSDLVLEANGGPAIFPGSKIASLAPINALKIGDASGLFSIYQALAQQYSDITGITPARLGAATKSHTTRYSKQVEVVQGQSRTIAFTKSIMRNGLRQYLELLLELCRKVMDKKRISIYIHEYGGYIELSKKSLPENVYFEVFGAGNPVEEEQSKQERFMAAQQAIQLDLLRIQQGMQPNMDISALQKQMLLEAGWTDIDAIFTTSTSKGVLNAATGEQGVPGANSGVAEALPAAIQAFQPQGGF